MFCIHILFNIHGPWNTIAFCDWKLICTEFMSIVFINESLMILTGWCVRPKNPVLQQILSKNECFIATYWILFEFSRMFGHSSRVIFRIQTQRTDSPSVASARVLDEINAKMPIMASPRRIHGGARSLLNKTWMTFKPNPFFPGLMEIHSLKG